MSINDDKRELLKLKQGIIEESEIIKEEKPPKIELHGKEWFDNFLYHNKVKIIFITVAVLVAVFLVFDFLNREVMDVRVLLVSATDQSSLVLTAKSGDIKKAFEEFCPDFNSDGKVNAEAFLLDINRGSFTDPAILAANQTKLFGELRTGVGQIIIGDIEAFQAIIGEEEKIEDYFTDLTELYPDNSLIENRFYYKLNDSNLFRAANWETALKGDLFLVVRKNTSGFGNNTEETKKYREQALEILDNIINNKFQIKQ